MPLQASAAVATQHTLAMDPVAKGSSHGGLAGASAGVASATASAGAAQTTREPPAPTVAMAKHRAESSARIQGMSANQSLGSIAAAEHTSTRPRPPATTPVHTGSLRSLPAGFHRPPPPPPSEPPHGSAAGGRQALAKVVDGRPPPPARRRGSSEGAFAHCFE
jgi:hypothetical protein